MTYAYVEGCYFNVWEKVAWIELTEDVDQVQDFVKKGNKRAFRSYN
jgi:hypothetical protein